MTSDEVLNSDNPDGAFASPWALVLGALGITAATFILSLLLPETWTPGLLLVVFPGVVAAAVAIVRTPRSPGVIGLAAFVSLIGSLVASIADWDSIALLMRVLAAFGAFSALVLLLPSAWRRAVVSLVLLFHFAGILSAVTNVQPAPWVSQIAWTYVFRPYLQFMYLNNAYHFYSPEPGPASLLWFRIEYESKNGHRYWRWVKVPELAEDRTRELAEIQDKIAKEEKKLTEMASVPGSESERTEKEAQLEDLREQVEILQQKIKVSPSPGAPVRPDGAPLGSSVEYCRRLSLASNIEMLSLGSGMPNEKESIKGRQRAGEVYRIPDKERADLMSYRYPNELARQWLGSYVRHVAAKYPHEKHPELQVAGVKVYLVTHQMLTPAQIDEGIDPNDPTTFLPYFMGEYDKEGQLLKEQDGFLYWLVPIIRIPKEKTSEEELGKGKGPLKFKHHFNPDDYLMGNYFQMQSEGIEEGSGS